MRRRRLWRSIVPALVAVLIVIGGAGTVFAQTATSPNYQVTETQIGNGASQESCSGSYCARVSIGDITSGNTMMSNTASFDDNATSEPFLEMIIETGESNLGVLTTEQTATKTTMVKVRSYLSDGYIMQLIGDPPKFQGHTLSTPSVPTLSVPGVEQFAINVVANTSPSVGANPVQVPDSGLPFGAADALYSTPNMFKYSSGEIIARSLTDSGRTDYTISMIVNISSATPAGNYTGDFMTVLMPAY